MLRPTGQGAEPADTRGVGRVQQGRGEGRLSRGEKTRCYLEFERVVPDVTVVPTTAPTSAGTVIARAANGPLTVIENVPAAVTSRIPAAVPTSAPTTAASNRAEEVDEDMPLLVPRGR